MQSISCRKGRQSIAPMMAIYGSIFCIAAALEARLSFLL
jgi:hypothetical protein